MTDALFFDSRTKACTLCARGEFTPLRALPRHKRRGCDTALRAKCFSRRTRRREKQIKSYSRRCGTANSVRLFRIGKAKPFPCDLFPHLQLSAVHDVAERPRGRLRDGKGEPCVVQTDEREQPEHRQQDEARRAHQHETRRDEQRFMYRLAAARVLLRRTVVAQQRHDACLQPA